MPKVELTCPHCGGHFEYEYIPGASASAVRLGTKRYMKCPLCSRWGTFDLHPKASLNGVPRSEDAPVYDDRRHFLRQAPWLFVPFGVILISLIWASAYPAFVFWLDISMVLLLLIGVLVALATARLPLRK